MKVRLLAIINKMLENKGDPILQSLEDNLSLSGDLGFDSLDLAEFTAHVDAEFGIDVFEDGIVDTIREVLWSITNGRK
jgi:acyl carrier protein